MLESSRTMPRKGFEHKANPMSVRTRVLPSQGWLNAGDAHWQSRWQAPTLRCRRRAKRRRPCSAAGPARAMAADWGAPVQSLATAGHINADSGLGDWPEGLRWRRTVEGGR